MSYTVPKPYFSQNWPMPNDYHTLGPEAKKEARQALLSSWWDPNRPDILITDPYKFTVAFRFHVETFVKKAPSMRRVFARPDCRWVDRWMKMVPHPSVAGVGFRGSSKTVWMVHQLSQFVAICRPGTPVAVSEYNADRTEDELGTIQGQLEDNELLEAEFGALKPPKYGRFRWSSQQLDLMNNSQIRGISVKAAQRGRHPLLFVLDDVEKDQESEKEEWREDFMEKFFFKVVIGMMRPGSHLLWWGTFLHPAACLLTAVKKLDKRFQFYKTIDCPLVVRKVDCPACDYETIEDIDNDLRERCPECDTEIHYHEGAPKAKEHFGPGAITMWPEYYSIEDAVLMLEGKGTPDQRIRAMGPTTFWTEMMNRPELGGDRMFERSDRKHGYRIVMAGEDKIVERMQLAERRPYEDWLSSLRITSGVDVADSLSKQADYSAVVIEGFDPYGFCYLLDAWEGRVRYYELIQKAFEMWSFWGVSTAAWDETALATVISHQVMMMLEDLRAAGQTVPRFVPLKLTRDSKTRRISRLQVPMIQGRLLFPVLNEIDGFAAMKHRHARAIRRLIQQIDRFTSKGKGTAHDDLLDAFEMGFFVNAGYRPDAPKPVHETDQVIEELKKIGVQVTRGMLPQAMWTPQMALEARGLKVPKKKNQRRPRIWR
jgi:hypothetical protein